MPLISRDDSLLIVIDLQPAFWGERLGEQDAEHAAAVARRAAWLAGAATALGVPAVVTEEDKGRNGPTDAAVLAALGPGAPVFAKPVFGLADSTTSWPPCANDWIRTLQAARAFRQEHQDLTSPPGFSL